MLSFAPQQSTFIILYTCTWSPGRDNFRVLGCCSTFPKLARDYIDRFVDGQRNTAVEDIRYLYSDLHIDKKIILIGEQHVRGVRGEIQPVTLLRGLLLDMAYSTPYYSVAPFLLIMSWVSLHKSLLEHQEHSLHIVGMLSV